MFNAFAKQVGLLLLFSINWCIAIADSGSCIKIENTLYLIQKLHYSPPQFDKTFAAAAIEKYLFYIDGQCVHLHESDLTAIREIQDNESSVQSVLCKTIEYLIKVYPKRLLETDSLLVACKTKKYTWHKNETLVYYESFEPSYPKSKEQKAKRIDQYVKLYTLRQLDLAGKLVKDYAFEQNDELRLKAITRLRNGIAKKNSSVSVLNSYLEEHLLQAMVSACDPHSDYFTPIKKTRFTRALSHTVDDYGFTCDENQHEQIEIVGISPGSSAWKCNNLNVGDRITGVKFKNKPRLDLSDYSVEEFQNLLYSSSEKEIDLTVVKKNGSTVETHLVKTRIQSEENAVNGYVLSKEHPIGYISLPSFYTDFSKTTTNGSANDVAKEIVKLNGDNIEGLILDLRNNGGGSIEEAMNLAGIFIDMAPLFIEQVQSLKPIVMKDLNRGAIYNGPLIVLINQGSASASELLAQILKTQHRAIIVGSSSYGKATGQIVVPLDTTYSMYAPTKKYKETDGYLKITIEMLYDLSGSTYQQTGVTPHIVVPDLWSGLSEGERGYSNALPNIPISKKVKVEVQPDSKVGVCAAKSNDRIQKDLYYKQMVVMRDSLRIWQNTQVLPLYPPSYYDLLQKNERIYHSIDTARAEHSNSIDIIPNNSDAEIIKVDSFLENIIKHEIEDLKKDILLREAYRIMLDYNAN